MCSIISSRKTLHYDIKALTVWKCFRHGPHGRRLSTCFSEGDGRSRLSSFWVPTGGIAKEGSGKEDSHAMLLRGGFLRQAHSGLYQFLPLGLRIQEKLERLLDKHMIKLGASKVSLSTFSSEALWKKSGRLRDGNSELFRFQDRRGKKYLLSPTHEEEITTLVGNVVNSYKDLPIRLYQISRKYRDEPRPRQGLFRTREFLMKDLYTFDSTPESALQTYYAVRKAYSAFFNEFKIPYMTAEADSGDIGGDLSHEFHFPTSKGEDNIISCNSCAYVANEELSRTRRSGISFGSAAAYAFSYRLPEVVSVAQLEDLGKTDGQSKSWFGISHDRSTLYHAIFPQVVEGSKDKLREAHFNPHSLKSTFEDLDLSVEKPLEAFGCHPTGARTMISSRHLVQAFDARVSQSLIDNYNKRHAAKEQSFTSTPLLLFDRTDISSRIGKDFDLIKVEGGDVCPKCSTGSLQVQAAVELGHTFHLGTRYSKPLNANVPFIQYSQPSEHLRLGEQSSEQSSKEVPIEMGCHGIGVSRIIAAVADYLADEKGLNWPRVMAPFEAIIIPRKGCEDAAIEILDSLTGATSKEYAHSKPVDAILDDRDKGMAWKLHDADLIGYPIVIILGKSWIKERRCEIQCRRLDSLNEEVPLAEIRPYVLRVLAKL